MIRHRKINNCTKVGGVDTGEDEFPYGVGVEMGGGEHLFTIGLALLLANTKYFSEHFGGQASAAKVGAIAGLVVDVGIIFYVLTRFFL